jgi:hypothetical protein
MFIASFSVTACTSHFILYFMPAVQVHLLFPSQRLVCPDLFVAFLPALKTYYESEKLHWLLLIPNR